MSQSNFLEVPETTFVPGRPENLDVLFTKKHMDIFRFCVAFSVHQFLVALVAEKSPWCLDIYKHCPAPQLHCIVNQGPPSRNPHCLPRAPIALLLFLHCSLQKSTLANLTLKLHCCPCCTVLQCTALRPLKHSVRDSPTAVRSARDSFTWCTICWEHPLQCLPGPPPPSPLHDCLGTQ